MAFQKNYGELETIQEPPCIHLRSKAIYVTGELKKPRFPDEEGSDNCWCNVSQHVYGPDRGDVSRRLCVPGRECYRDTH